MITAAATSEIQKEEMEDVQACVSSAVVSSTADSSKKKRNISRKRKLSNNVGVANTATAAETVAATEKKAEMKRIWEAAIAAATQKKAEKKKIREAATGKRVAAITAKKMKEAADQKPPQGQEKWVDKLGNPAPIYKYSTEEVGLINMKNSLNNRDEKKQYNSTKVFAGNNPMDLSLKKEQEPNLAWVEDKNMISKLQQQERDQQELQQSPQYINI